MSIARLVVVLTVLPSAVLTGCGGGGGSSQTDGGTASAEAWDFPEHQFVIDRLRLPLTEAESQQLGFDLNGDGLPDNLLGSILVSFGSSMGATSPQTSVDESVAAGRTILLIDLFARDLQSEPLSNLWLLLGTAADPPLTTGPPPGSAWSAAPDGPLDSILGGAIAGGHALYGGTGGRLRVDFPITDEESLAASLEAARAEFDVAVDGSTLDLARTSGAVNPDLGRIGGAISRESLDTEVMPSLARIMQGQVVKKCTMNAGVCECVPNTGGAAVQRLFDENGDCSVTLEEFVGNALVQTALAGDVELPDGTMGLSLGFGFHAVTATFTHPAPPGR
jgi:hypothetical protein